MLSILQEFDFRVALNELDLNRFFEDGYWLSIKAKINSSKKKYETWNVLILKATAAKKKVWHKLILQIKNEDQYCLRITALV